MISFRRLAEGDLPLMARWLDSAFVRQWYPDGPSPEQVAAKYRSRIRGEQPTDPYLIVFGGRPIGCIQAYMVRDYPEYARDVGVEPGAAGLDLFIGEEAYAHRGLGLGPEPANRVAIRAYEKAGFRALKTVAVTGEAEPEVIMAITREAAQAGGPTPEENPPSRRS